MIVGNVADDSDHPKTRLEKMNNMSMLESITRGRESKPPRLLVYGQEGTGKSTFAAGAPSPVFVQTEDGLGEIDTAKFPLAKKFEEVTDALTALRDEPHDFQTVVIDSADWLERLVWDRVCRDFGVRSIEKADGGYGKGYVHALTHWRQMVDLLNDLRDRRGIEKRVLIVYNYILWVAHVGTPCNKSYFDQTKHKFLYIDKWNNTMPAYEWSLSITYQYIK